jgi:hypothetical protein
VSAEGHEWAYTLANFDAIVNDSDTKIIIRQDLDHGRSGMLAAILDAKLAELRWPRKNPAAGVMTRAEEDQRPDLEDLHRAITDIRERERAAYRRAEDAFEQSGYLALARIEHTVAQLEPREPRPMNTEAEKLEAFSELLKEVSGGYHHLREAVRPPEAGRRLDKDGQNALEYHEQECRKALDRAHRPIRERLESTRRIPRWNELDRGAKIGVVGVGITILGSSLRPR